MSRKRAQPKPDRRLPIVLACFFLSGFAALLYQTVWTREFAFVFGTSELAVATVLAAYMGGLAAGAALAGRWVSRLRRPVLAYGLLELGIALSALLVPLAIHLAMRLSRLLFGGEDAPPSAGGLTISLFYLASTFVILLVPTLFMGATLPVLARSLVERDEQIGPRIGLLYATNTLGAVLGTITAAFLLLPAVGLRWTVFIGAGVNALVFAAAALGLGKQTVAPAGAAMAARAPWRRRTWVLPILLVSGAASFTYEVLWSRLLGHILGGSVYAFATMLATFLIGITAGSAVAASISKRPARALERLAVAQIGIAVFSYLAFFGVDRLPYLALKIGAGSAAGLPANAALCALVLLPAALCIGATFPLAVRALAEGSADAGPASARVYAWNTVGAIAGSIGSGFFLIPAAGYQGALAAAVAVNLGLAVAAALAGEPRSKRVAIAAAALLVLLALFRPATPWTILHFRPLSPMHIVTKPPDLRKVVYLGVGTSGTVLLEEENLYWELRVNGNPEAGISGPGYFTWAKSAEWLTGLPVLARPEARSMLVVGLGGGTLLEALPRSLESVHVLELEPEVLAANRKLSGLRSRDPLADPRIKVFLNDGRGALYLTGKRYDAIVSQPSHPWTAGASHLYTREFFELVRDHLSPGGVFLQWIGAKYVDETLLRTLVATMTGVFPSVRAYRPSNGPSLLFLGSDAPLPVEETAARAIAASPEEFLLRSVQCPEDVAAALALDEEAARRFADGAAVNTDDYNLLEMESPRILRSARSTESLLAGLDALFAADDPLPRVRRAEWRDIYLHRILRASGQKERAARLAEGAADPARKLLLKGMTLLSSNSWKEALDAYREALRIDPSSYEARVLLARALAGRAAEESRSELQALLPSLPEPARAAIGGLVLHGRKEWDSIRALDPALAQVAADDPVFDIASRLRALWRLASGDAALAREAIRIMDATIPFSRAPFSTFPADSILRAQLFLAAGDADTALALLLDALETDPRRKDQAFLGEAERLFSRIPPAAERAEKMNLVGAELRKRLK